MLLLTLDVWEWDGEGWKRWLPSADERFRADLAVGAYGEDARAAQSPSGIDLDGGCINLYYCPVCPKMPHAQWYDR